MRFALVNLRSCQYNKDKSKFVIGNNIYDWKGTLYGKVQGDYLCHNQDKSKFLTHYKVNKYIDILFIMDWSGKQYGETIIGKLINFNKDSSKFLTSYGIYDWNGKRYGKTKIGELEDINNDSSRFLTTQGIYDWNGKEYGSVKGDFINVYRKNASRFSTSYGVYDWDGNLIEKNIEKKIFNLEKTKFLLSKRDSLFIYSQEGKLYLKIKGSFLYFNQDLSRILISTDDYWCIYDWNGKLFGEIRGIFKDFNYAKSKILCFYNSYRDSSFIYDLDCNKLYSSVGRIYNFNRDSTRFITNNYKKEDGIYDWDGKLYKLIEGFQFFNRDTSRLLTYNGIYFGIYDWEGKLYKTINNKNNEFKKLDSPFSQFCFSFDNYTVFYDMNWEISSVYSGQFFKIEEDGKHVVMRKPYYNGYIYETRPLYQNIHEFMKNEVAELTPDQRVLYGLEDYLKD